MDASTIRTSSRDYLLNVCETIFKARDLAKVESQVANASKIRFGLKALDILDGQGDLNSQAARQILTGLTKLCKIYSQQSIPQINV